MKTVVWLKTARVYALNDDSTPKIERTTVKLEDGKCFNKFISNMHLRGLIKSEPPCVVKVLQRTGKDFKGEYQEIDKSPWQKLVEEKLRKEAAPVKVDYKRLSEDQANELRGIKERLEALEKTDPPKNDNRADLEAKANTLGITFRNNIGDTKLLEKIQAIEPEYNLS